VQLKWFTLHCGPNIQTKTSLATAGIYCTISPPLSDAMELFHIPGPAAANVLSPKVLYVRVTTHARLPFIMQYQSVRRT